MTDTIKNPHVKQFGERYRAIQIEGKRLRADFKLLLGRLKKFGKKCSAMFKEADNDRRLYRPTSDLPKLTQGEYRNRWNTAVLFRLQDFGYYDFAESAEGIDTILFNLVHTPFVERRRTGKKKGGMANEH